MSSVNISGGEFALIEFDNDARFHKASCGSISWQIMDENIIPLGSKASFQKRLAITYDIPWR